MTQLLESVEVATGPNPSATVIWMHGLGADGHDFVPIVKELDVNTLPGLADGVRFIFPHAPMRPVTINNGMVMRAWYDIKVVDLMRQEDDAGLRASQMECEKLIANEVARGIPASAIVLAGFSQGCAMALHTGLRHPARLAGIMALSGYLPLASTVAAERSAANSATPIFMAHGTQDPMVIISRAEASRDALASLGYKVQWHTYAMPHSVHPQEIADIGRFLKAVLGASARAT